MGTRLSVFFPAKALKKSHIVEKKKVTMSRVSKAPITAQGRVPDKYRSYAKQQSDIKTTVLEIRPQTSSSMNIDGSQNNIIQFYFPNNPGMFLLTDSVF